MASLTILMPAHNAMPHLPEATRSILEQTLEDLVLLIVDDGSTDGTRDYLDQLDDPRVRILRGPRCGLGATLNLGLAACETEFLARMDADDVSLPERLARQQAFLRQHPEVGMVGCQFSYFGGAGRRVFSPILPGDHAEIVAKLLAGELAIAHGTLMFRTEVLQAIGGYRIAGMGEDWDVFLRMAEVSRVANLGEVLYFYRIHRDNADVQRFVDLRIGIEYACHCADARKLGRYEPTPEEFRRERDAHRRSRLLGLLDAYALSQYRLALVALAERHVLTGYARLLWSAVCSPYRTLARLRRMRPQRAAQPTP